MFGTDVISILGTATEVGKTWMTSHLITELRGRGITVAARKPAQSFSTDELGTTDAEVLGTASAESPTDVCPSHRWYPYPMAPPMAAALLDLPMPTMAELTAETIIPEARFVFVETAGGLKSPIAIDGDCLQYARRLGPTLHVLCADAGLGTINSIRLAQYCMEGDTMLVFLNRYDEENIVHRCNRDWLCEVNRFDVSITIKQLADKLLRTTFGVGPGDR